MKNNFQVRTIEELREHFDLDKAIEYFLDGKLLAWLEARYYEQESVAIREMGKDEAQLHQKLCNILGVEHDEAEIGVIDVEAIAERNRRLNELKQYTSDPSILEKVDQVAFNQEDLADLLDEGVHDIYLCNNSFVIPLQMTHRRYIGIGKAEAVIRSSERVDFDAKGISFEAVHFDSAYEKLHNETPEQLYQKGLDAENRKDYVTALDYYRKVADAGNSDGFFKLGWFYANGYGVPQDYAVAYQWYKKAAEMGDMWAINNIGAFYHNGTGVPRDYSEAYDWYQKAAEMGNSLSMMNIIALLRTDNQDLKLKLGLSYQTIGSFGLSWAEKAADAGNIKAMVTIANSYLDFYRDVPSNEYYWMNLDPYNEFSYSYEKHCQESIPFVSRDKQKAIMWYKKAASNGDAEAMRRLYSWFKEDLSSTERIEWGEKAAESGYIKAMLQIASEGKEFIRSKREKWAQKILSDSPSYESAAFYALHHIYLFNGGYYTSNRSDFIRSIDYFKKFSDAKKKHGLDTSHDADSIRGLESTMQSYCHN